MGCSGSSATPPASGAGGGTAVDRERRRLSVGAVDGEEAQAEDTGTAEADRGLIENLANEDAIKTLAQRLGGGDGKGRKFSISSETDKDLNRRTSFADKT